MSDSAASTSPMLGLQVCITVPGVQLSLQCLQGKGRHLIQSNVTFFSCYNHFESHTKGPYFLSGYASKIVLVLPFPLRSLVLEHFILSKT